MRFIFTACISAQTGKFSSIYKDILKRKKVPNIGFFFIIVAERIPSIQRSTETLFHALSDAHKKSLCFIPVGFRTSTDILRPRLLSTRMIPNSSITKTIRKLITSILFKSSLNICCYHHISFITFQIIVLDWCEAPF